MSKNIGMAMIMMVGASFALAARAAAPAAERAKELTLDLGDQVTMKLVLIPAGRFLMGSPETEEDRDKGEVLHAVTISKPFYMGVYEVTVSQYAQFVKATGQEHNEPEFKQTGNHPVVNVDWNAIQAFCKWTSSKTGKTVVLPTEAQWEYACRAGTKTRFGFGDKAEDLHTYANYCNKSLTKKRKDAERGDGFAETAPVGSLKPNDWGLYDLHGNVAEWCSDGYGDYKRQAVTDPAGADRSLFGVVRGGSWVHELKYCRSASRLRGDRSCLYSTIGFRVVVLALGKD